MKRNETDFLATDIAALSESESAKAGTLLSAKIENDNLEFEEREQYNNIWLYLSTRAELCKNRILE